MPADDLSRFAAAFEGFHAKLVGRLSGMPDGPERAQFRAFVDHLQTTQRQFLVESEKLSQQLQDTMQKAQSNIDAAKAKTEAASAAREEKLAKLAAAKAPKPVKELDPNLGRRLRKQLLDEFGDLNTPKAKPSTEELEWEWEWNDFLDA
jgi:septum formation inhibitor MinC